MLACLPRSVCSWNFLIRGTSGGDAELTFHWLTEQGTIYWDGTEYDVIKHGPLSGHWTLECDGALVVDAQKTSAFKRTFELATDRGALTLQAQSVLTRGFDLRQSGVPVGTIQPMHMFTRRANIDCEAEVDELIQLFAFWLVVMTWKRAARKNNSH